VDISEPHFRDTHAQKKNKKKPNLPGKRNVG
jgi:hypothetical protein